MDPALWVTKIGLYADEEDMEGFKLYYDDGSS